MGNFGEEGMPVESLNAYTDEESPEEMDGLTKNLSSLNEMYHSASSSSADGRQMRRRLAMAGAVCLLVVGLILFLTVGGGASGSGKSSSNGSGSAYPQARSDAYTLVSRQTIEDLQSTVALYKHEQSGMQVVTMIPKDPNEDGTFGVNFRTPSESDDGVQYVVENAVRAGSVKYPAKDPFNQIKRGSLQTYMESWTDRDRTSYVAATRNLADYKNIMAVMIDAVFHPLFVHEEHKWIYRQEGWRLESPDGKRLGINGYDRQAAITLQSRGMFFRPSCLTLPWPNLLLFLSETPSRLPRQLKWNPHRLCRNRFTATYLLTTCTVSSHAETPQKSSP